MKPIQITLSKESHKPYYFQIYLHIKEEILKGELKYGERLPSLRHLSRTLGVSLTTVAQAYDQLLVEGYIFSKPQSGYYIDALPFDVLQTHIGAANSAVAQSGKGNVDTSPVLCNGGKAASPVFGKGNVDTSPAVGEMAYTEYPTHQLLEQQYRNRIFDLSAFDFNKWKKCVNKVLTDYPAALSFESDPQGEEVLRYEISKYLYRSRGVECTPDQVVIGAGTQQIVGHLSRILSAMNIANVAVEDPGYLPVRNIFRDCGFAITPVTVKVDGIDIQALPANISSAAYVCPSNQFPTGAVMPVGRRYQLLEWANKNNSIIIEDDYDSELRYFGKPIPPLQSMDKNGRVVYLGSFSTTLFPAIKISYMVMTEEMTRIFQDIKNYYSQTCSKTEQLSLSLFMEKGYYQINLKKLRNLYAQKLSLLENALSLYGKGEMMMEKASSGRSVIIRLSTEKSAFALCEAAEDIGIFAFPISKYAETRSQGNAQYSEIRLQETAQKKEEAVILYYYHLPLNQIETYIKTLAEKWLS